MGRQAKMSNIHIDCKFLKVNNKVKDDLKKKNIIQARYKNKRNSKFILKTKLLMYLFILT